MDSLPHTMARNARLFKQVGLHYMAGIASHYNKVREIPSPGAKNRRNFSRRAQVRLATRLAEVPRKRPVYLICQGGFRSLRAAQFLRQQGFEDVVSVKGGTQAWRAAGKPLAQGSVSAEPSHVVET